MVGVAQDDLGAGGGGRVIDVVLARQWLHRDRRNPIGRTGEEQIIARHADFSQAHWMLFGFARLVALNESDQPELPVFRLGRAFVVDLVQNIVEVVDRVDYPAHIGFLRGGNGRDLQRITFQSLAVAVRIAVDDVYLVAGVEGVTFPGVEVAVLPQPPDIKEHDAHINAAAAGGDHPVPESIKIGRIEPGDVEFETPI